MNIKLIRKAEVLDLCAISNATLYRLIARGLFPAPVVLSTRGRAVAWFAPEVQEWIESRPRSQLRRVVKEGK